MCIDTEHVLIIFLLAFFFSLQIKKSGKRWLPDVEPGKIVYVFYTSVFSSFLYGELCMRVLLLVCRFKARNGC